LEINQGYTTMHGQPIIKMNYYSLFADVTLFYRMYRWMILAPLTPLFFLRLIFSVLCDIIGESLLNA